MTVLRLQVFCECSYLFNAFACAWGLPPPHPTRIILGGGLPPQIPPMAALGPPLSKSKFAALSAHFTSRCFRLSSRPPPMSQVTYMLERSTGKYKIYEQYLKLSLPPIILKHACGCGCYCRCIFISSYNVPPAPSPCSEGGRMPPP